LTIVDAMGREAGPSLEVAPVLDNVVDYVVRVLNDVWGTFAHNWPFLAASILMAAALSVYVGTDRMGAWLRRRTSVAVVGGVALATLTPFCSCGTMAVVLGLLATTSPWPPIVAFMVSSPLTSPAQFLLSGGLFGWPFALTYFIGATVLGLAAGAVTAVISRTSWLEGQARMKPREKEATSSCRKSCCCCQPATDERPRVSVGPGAASPAEFPSWQQRLKLDAFGKEVWALAKRMVLYFFGFAAIGFALIELVPTEFVTRWLGGNSPFAVVLAALLGIPIYITTDGSLPMVAALMKGGMGPGPAIAFLITGSGTSVAAIAGMLVIAKARVVSLIVGILVVGAILLGLIANVLLQ
jgi:uncharacterized membrane protein YraQ (UPF0718 family)